MIRMNELRLVVSTASLLSICAPFHMVGCGAPEDDAELMELQTSGLSGLEDDQGADDFDPEEESESLARSAPASCTFTISADSFFVQKDQATSTYNYEGYLELAGQFTAQGTMTDMYPASGNISAKQGDTKSINLAIREVSMSARLAR